MSEEAEIPRSQDSSLRRAWRFSRDLYKQVLDNDLYNHAAEMAYYGMMAVFPFFLLVTVLLGFLPIPDLFGEIMRLLADYAPPRVVTLLEETVREVTSVQDLPLPKLVLTLSVCLWWTLGAMGSTTRGLNKAFGSKCPRNYGKYLLLNFGFTLVFSQLLLVAMVLIMLGPVIHEEIAARIDLGALEPWALRTFRWAVVLLMLFVTHAGIYWICPAMKRKFRLFTPGTIFVVASWIAVSYGLRVYLQYVHSYDMVFGSLGTVVILLFWFFLMAFLLLFGAAIDAVLHPEDVREWSDAEMRAAQRPFSWRMAMVTGLVTVGIPIAILLSLEPDSFTPNAHLIRGDLKQAVDVSMSSGDQKFESPEVDRLLRAHVDPATGLVDYEALRGEREAIDAWLQRVEEVDIQRLDPRHLEAMLGNLYTIGVWVMVLDGHANGRAVTERSPAALRTFVKLAGEHPVSLIDIKNRLLRPLFEDPRLVLALHDGSRSRPPLLPEALDGDRLDAQLERVVEMSLTPPWTAVQEDRIVLPRLFELYAADFREAEGSLVAWLRARLPAEAQALLDASGIEALAFSPADSQLNRR